MNPMTDFFHPDLRTQFYWQHVHENRCHWCGAWIPKPYRTCREATGEICIMERAPDDEQSLLSIIYGDDYEDS